MDRGVSLNRGRAIAVYRLKQKGYTTKEIAHQMGMWTGSVKPMVLLGERLLNEEKE